MLPSVRHGDHVDLAGEVLLVPGRRLLLPCCKLLLLRLGVEGKVALGLGLGRRRVVLTGVTGRRCARRRLLRAVLSNFEVRLDVGLRRLKLICLRLIHWGEVGVRAVDLGVLRVGGGVCTSDLGLIVDVTGHLLALGLLD